MKLCKICNTEKPYNATAKVSSKASGFQGQVCWNCHLCKVAKSRATPEGRAANALASRTCRPASNVPKPIASTKAARAAKLRATPEGRAKHIAATLAWKKKYPERNAASRMQYHAAQLQRVPAWADLNDIKQVYIEAAKQGLAVDHIYPLRGELVSGLHVANNLQLLTKSENSRKGNRLLETYQT